MLKQLLPAIRATIILSILTGLVFPITVTIIAQFLFPKQANGSLVYNKTGQIIGSQLIGQQFVQPQYFHPRPSAAGTGYAGEASAGTNLGPTSAKFILGQLDDKNTKDIDKSFAGIKQLSENYVKENCLSSTELPPVDAVTRSGSGLDPDISQINALYQARRIAKARGLSLQTIASLIKKHSQDRQFGILGEPRVNVLSLNIALENLDHE